MNPRGNHETTLREMSEGDIVLGRISEEDLIKIFEKTNVEGFLEESRKFPDEHLKKTWRKPGQINSEYSQRKHFENFWRSSKTNHCKNT